jgi:hypothetical protein
MLIKDLELKDSLEKYDFITENLSCFGDKDKGLGIYLVSKADILYQGHRLNETSTEEIETFFSMIENMNVEDLWYFTSYESENFFLLRNKTYQKVSTNMGWINDARSFMYDTIFLEIGELDTKDCVLLVKLDH